MQTACRQTTASKQQTRVLAQRKDKKSCFFAETHCFHVHYDQNNTLEIHSRVKVCWSVWGKGGGPQALPETEKRNTHLVICEQSKAGRARMTRGCTHLLTEVSDTWSLEFVGNDAAHKVGTGHREGVHQAIQLFLEKRLLLVYLKEEVFRNIQLPLV